jgi:signal transduction histidine kinase
MKIGMPKRINMQIALLLLVCVALFHAAATAILLFSSPGPADPRNVFATTEATALASLNSASASERSKIVAALNDSVPELALALSAPIGTSPIAISDSDSLKARLPSGMEIGIVSVGTGEKLVATLQDGQKVSLSLMAPHPGFGRMALVTIGFVALSLLIFSLWGALAVTRPLIDFVKAVESFDLDTASAHIEERGSEEVRTAARAFNRMQNRIKEMVDQRTHMLAAVSHDLRTPITRMRLRAEYIEDGETKAKILRDLEQMHAMVGACLSYLRGGAPQEFQALDLASQLHTIVDQFVDVGANVRFEGAGEFIIHGNADELERAFCNLVDNAVKFAGGAEIAIIKNGQKAIVEVADHGPGIPPGKKKAMLQPFQRGSENPTLDSDEGFGLGLAIARAIVEAHGGRLELADRKGGGLLARATLPLAVIEK